MNCAVCKVWVKMSRDEAQRVCTACQRASAIA